MREILFKAKRDGSGEWVEGYYAECKGKTFIASILQLNQSA
jgi:hypothetical protein